jgi:hypothetical protein
MLEKKKLREENVTYSPYLNRKKIIIIIWKKRGERC